MSELNKLVSEGQEKGQYLRANASTKFASVVIHTVTEAHVYEHFTVNIIGSSYGEEIHKKFHVNTDVLVCMHKAIENLLGDRLDKAKQ